MAAFRTANGVREGHEWDLFEGAKMPAAEIEAFLKAVPFAKDDRRKLDAPAVPIPAIPARAQNRRPDVDAAGLRPDPGGDRTQRCGFRRPHRHHLARRHGLDQSGRLGQSPQIVRPPARQGPFQGGENSVHLCLGLRARRPAYGAGHRGDESLHSSLGAGTVASIVRRPAVAGGHALRSLHRPRSGCAQLRLLPGFPFPAGGDAFRHHAFGRRRRTSIHRHAPDRHGAGRAGRLRACFRG